MTRVRTVSQQRTYGQYSTPVRTVDYMVDLVLPYIQAHPEARILDPATGDGIFIDRLLAHGISPASVTGFDIDPDVIGKLQFGSLGPESFPATHHRDFLKEEPLNTQPWDVIIGNPPYKSKRESTYIQTHRAELETRFHDVGVHNLYALFVIHALTLLREGGFLCFVIQDSFLSNVSYRAFRSYLLEHCKIHEITLAPRRLFHGTGADVRSAILLLEKCTGPERLTERQNNLMRLTDRLPSEAYYGSPGSRRQVVPQQTFHSLHASFFAVGVPDSVLRLFGDSVLRLGDVVEGGTGISTGNDARFLKRVEDVQQLPDEEARAWVPFYKNGGAKAPWFYETPYRIHRDWLTSATTTKDYIARNPSYYFREGISCSSMGIGFSAAWMPPGCLFGVNANFFCDDEETCFYVLALLNSKLAKYLVRAVINRTNMVTAGYLKRLPYVEPPADTKRFISEQARILVHQARHRLEGPDNAIQAQLDPLFYDIYRLDADAIIRIEQFCANLFEAL